MGKHEGSLSWSSIPIAEPTLTSKKKDAKPKDLSSLELYRDALYEKRKSTREKALELIVEAFQNNVLHEFVEKNFETLLSLYISAITRRSGLERSFASQAVGLLALTVGFGGDARKVFVESFVPLSQSLRAGSIDVYDVLNSLAIVTFVGGNDAEETEKTLQIIWQFINPKPGSNVGEIKIPSSLRATAIYAWLFLYTRIDSRVLDSQSWQESVSYFSGLLNKEDRKLRMAGGEALALLLEKGCQDNNATEGLVEKIVNQVRDLSVEAGGKGLSKIGLISQRKMFGNFLEYLKDGYCPETSIKIGDDVLKTSTWSELIQWNFFKRYLRGGFFKHMQENELLLDVFKFTPKEKRVLGNQQKLSSSEKRMYKSPNSASNKERTRLRNKQRVSSEVDNLGQFAGAYVEQV